MSEKSSRCFPNVFVRRNQKYIAFKSTTQNVHSWRPCCLEGNRLPEYHDSLRAANQLGNGNTLPQSQGPRGETVTKTLVKFILSFQNFGKKIACAVRHNRIAIQLNTVVSHCVCNFFLKILER